MEDDNNNNTYYDHNLFGLNLGINVGFFFTCSQKREN